MYKLANLLIQKRPLPWTLGSCNKLFSWLFPNVLTAKYPKLNMYEQNPEYTSSLPGFPQFSPSQLMGHSSSSTSDPKFNSVWLLFLPQTPYLIIE